MMSNENIFSSMGDATRVVGMRDMHTASFIEGTLKDTTSSVIINLKTCDSAEKLNLEKLALNYDKQTVHLQCTVNCNGDHVNVTKSCNLKNSQTIAFDF